MTTKHDLVPNAQLNNLLAEYEAELLVADAVIRLFEDRLATANTKRRDLLGRISTAKQNIAMRDDSRNRGKGRKVFASGYLLTADSHWAIFAHDRLGLTFEEIGDSLRLSRNRARNIYEDARREVEEQERRR